MMKINNKGFTLVEVLVSVVILSIILLTFTNFFIMSNKSAVSSNEKLVAVHLAKATLERIKIKPYDYIKDPNTTGVDYEARPIKYSQNNCPNTSPCLDPFSVEVNQKTYNISVTASQKATSNDKNLKLINIVVNVELASSSPKISTKIEGYVKYD
jgi:prepilin-type N-terminal cleavage/methylation domain-containing protein